MFIKFLKQKVNESKTISRLQTMIENDEENINVKGVVGSLKSIILAHIFEKTSRPVVYISCEESQAESIKNDLELLVTQEKLTYFPAKEIFPHKKIASDSNIQSQRMESIEKLIEDNHAIVISSARGIARKVTALSEFKKNRIHFRVSKIIDFNAVVQKLIDLGFERQPMVEIHGDLSVRGGIIDIFSFSKENPVRIEFFGDKIESIRLFDVETQRSISSVEEILIYPKEYDITEGFHSDHSKEKQENMNNASLFDYLPQNAVLFWDEPELIGSEIDSIRLEKEKLYHLGEPDIDLSRHKIAPYFEWNDVQEMVRKFCRVNFISFKSSNKEVEVDFKAQAQEALRGNLKLLKNKVNAIFRTNTGSATAPKTAAFFLCEYSEQIERIQDLFEEIEIPPYQLVVKQCALNEGFYFPEIQLALFTYHQFYGRHRRLRTRRKVRNGLTSAQLKSLVIGDYVVHEDHGIGKFLGLKKISVSGNERECIHILYKDDDSLYVPLDRMNRVQKYSAKEGAIPTLNKLGGTEWQKLKKRTKRRIKDIANELIAIYAARKASKGFAFSSDSLWQKELEASFSYNETPDQEKAVSDVRADMESSKPMDRLVCGDVGYGKTEVAIRAAFKAVNDSKQVAMLVPTTILAQQHYNTFRERLKPFPVKIAMLSRFRTKKEQEIIIKGLKDGKVDIVIGTHRLLSKDLEFKDLGLLVIDEEQRFGVRHKERLKALKKTVDALTLTATPIPRTLHMSLIGARDMSNINTPPKNRLPIYTEVVEFDKVLIQEAILREVQRGGQVFFVHNRVQTIDAVADMIRRLVPEVSIVVGHGQLNSNQLERIMLDFMHGKYQVLVATMIIENGLDIPNVNTIIIHRSDRFGLAQLYQLRGRVGRSSQRAFAYLLIPPIRKITDNALKRLRTIEEFTELGAGFQIAMRDLEIRGAGNILGAEQSGFIDALGFDLYCKILDEAIKELKSGNVADKDKTTEKALETKIEVDRDIHIPSEYIEQNHIRLDFYRRLVDSKTLEEINKIEEELIDRFGKIPEQADDLLNILRMKIICSQLGIHKIIIKDQELLASFTSFIYEKKLESFNDWISQMTAKSILPFNFVQDKKELKIRLKIKTPPKNKLEYAKKFLQSLL